MELTIVKKEERGRPCLNLSIEERKARKILSSRIWKLNNKAQIRITRKNNKMKRNGIPGYFIKKEWDSLVHRQKDCCAICGNKEPFYGQFYPWLTHDHIIPVILGGSNDILNLQATCWDCNMDKGDKSPSGQMILPLFRIKRKRVGRKVFTNKKCLICGRTFPIFSPSGVKRKFCSLRCFGKSRGATSKKKVRKLIAEACNFCKKRFLRRIYPDYYQPKHTFCSKSCAMNFFWKNGILSKERLSMRNRTRSYDLPFGLKREKSGTIYVLKPDHPRANKNGYIPRSHLVWEETMHELLPSEAFLYHKDKNKENDEFRNLVLVKLSFVRVKVKCDSCSTEFSRIPSNIKKHNFCCRTCYKKWWAEVMAFEIGKSGREKSAEVRSSRVIKNIDGIDHRKCSRCKIYKTFDNFFYQKRDGRLTSFCKKCISDYGRDYNLKKKTILSEKILCEIE